jgi:hypothetical protein
MTPTVVLTPLAVALADAMARKTHFFTITAEARALCRVCGASFDLDEYAADDGVCAGPATC